MVFKIVLIESQVGHQRLVRKPLCFDWLQNDTRFASLLGNVERVIVPDEAYGTNANVSHAKDIWHAEKTATHYGIAHIKKKARRWGLSADDLIISASVDEILGRQALVELRSCYLSTP